MKKLHFSIQTLPKIFEAMPLWLILQGRINLIALLYPCAKWNNHVLKTNPH